MCAGDPDFDVYAAGGLNAFVCNTTFLGFDQFSFWKSCMAHTPTLSSSRTRSSPPAAPRCAAPRSSAPPRTRTSKSAGQPTPGPGALCFNIDGTPRPATGPWNAGAY